jgi:amino acid adenylation domain-containing protein
MMQAQFQIPLSYPQERFWLLDQLHPGNTAFNLARVFSIKGELDREVLQESFNILCARHEALRTAFPSPQGAPYQNIQAKGQLIIEYSDLSTEPDGLLEYIDKITNTHYRLDQDPLTRIHLIQTSPDEAVLIIAQHHIITDGTSFELLLSELGVCYDALIQGRQPDLPELTLSYSEYSIQQRAQLIEPKMHEKLTYWESNLLNAPALDLPADRPRPRNQTFNGALCNYEYPPEKLQQLHRLGAENVASLFMVMLTAFYALLHKLSSQDDFVIGTPITGRNRIETEKMQGLFLNTLALRMQLPGRATFRSLLETVKGTALNAYNAVEIPLEKIIETLQPERDQSRQPFFQVMINMVPKDTQTLKLSGLEVKDYPYFKPEAKFDIELYIRRTAEKNYLSWAYSTDLFDQVRIEQIAGQYTHLLDQILANPDIAVDELTLVTPNARALLPDPAASLQWADHPPTPRLIHDWVCRTPDAPAVQDDAAIWSYQEFSDRAHLVAQFILNNDIEKGEVVAVTGQSSNQLIASMLGVWLAGGILLTIPHDFPPARRDRMLEIARAKLLIEIDAEFAVLPLPPRPLPDISSKDPAYVFFTSGTTGEPKGILGTHGGLSHFLAWQRGEFEISPADRFAQTTKLSFDMLLRDVFLPLASGSTLVISTDDDFKLDFLNWMQGERITRFHMVPSLLKFWLSETAKIIHPQDTLRTVFLAGEPLSSSLINDFRALAGSSVEIVNLYGPTETTLTKSFLRVADTPTPGLQSIGTPLPDCQLLIFNQTNQLCGFFEPGEIIIRTPFRTLGYLNASNAAFFTNPYTNEDQDIVFRTGDIGWYLPDGKVAIGGRKDNQVKVRGVRIAPEMISSLLSEFNGVHNNTVVPLLDQDQNLFLAAYAVADKGITTEQIRKYLQERLPPSYVPSAITLIPQIPLTSNGKVDADALPRPDDTSRQIKVDSEALNDTERKLAAIWAKVLNIDILNMNATFFELGGHSLLAVKILNRVRNTFNIDLPLMTLFEDPTIREMADQLSDHNT